MYIKKKLFNVTVLLFCLFFKLHSMQDPATQLRDNLAKLKTSLTQLKSKLGSLTLRLIDLKKRVDDSDYSGHMKISLNAAGIKALKSNFDKMQNELTNLLKDVDGFDYTNKIVWKTFDRTHISLRSFANITSNQVEAIKQCIPKTLKQDMNSKFAQNFNKIQAYEPVVFVVENYPYGMTKQKIIERDRVVVFLRVRSQNDWLNDLVKLIDDSLLGVKDLPGRKFLFDPHITLLIINDVSRQESTAIKKRIESTIFNLSNGFFKISRKFDFRYYKTADRNNQKSVYFAF